MTVAAMIADAVAFAGQGHPDPHSQWARLGLNILAFGDSPSWH